MRHVTILLLCVLLSGCTFPRRDALVVRAWQSEPSREAQDSRPMRDLQGVMTAGIVAIANIVGNADPTAMTVAVVAGAVGIKLIERTSDARFHTTEVTIPWPPQGGATLEIAPDGTIRVLQGGAERRWLHEAEGWIGLPSPGGSGVDPAPAVIPWEADGPETNR